MPISCMALLALLLVAGLGLRLGWALSRSSDAKALAELPDQLEYLQAAKHLAGGEGLWYVDGRFDQKILAGRMPGYPLFVAAFGGDVRLVRIAQCLIDLSTAVAVFLIARRWLNPWRALLACAFVVFSPLLVAFTGLLLSETLYVAMLAWSVYFVLERRTVALGLILCALATHIRPSGILMPLVLAGMAPWAWRSDRPWRASVQLGLLSIAITVAVLAPWAMRNHAVLGRTIWLTTNGGVTLYDGVHPGATGASDQRFVQAMPELKQMTELQRDDHFARLSREAAVADPVRFIRLAIIKIARTWSPIPLSDQFGSNRMYVLAGLGYALPLFVLVVWGLIRSELSWRVRLLLLSPAILITAMHAISVGSLRYRLPAEPLLAVIAVSGVVGTSRGNQALEAGQA